MRYEWTLKDRRFTPEMCAGIARTMDAAFAYVEEYGDKSGEWMNPLEDEHVNDMEPFMDLSGWQMRALREIVGNDDARVSVEPFLLEGDTVSGEFSNLNVLGIIVSNLMKAEDMREPVVFDCLCSDLDNGLVVMIGQNGWGYVDTSEIASDPGGSLVGLANDVAGIDAARAILSDAGKAVSGIADRESAVDTEKPSM